jgi:hypothetical protein
MLMLQYAKPCRVIPPRTQCSLARLPPVEIAQEVYAPIDNFEATTIWLRLRRAVPLVIIWASNIAPLSKTGIGYRR